MENFRSIEFNCQTDGWHIRRIDSFSEKGHPIIGQADDCIDIGPCSPWVSTTKLTGYAPFDSRFQGKLCVCLTVFQLCVRHYVLQFYIAIQNMVQADFGVQIKLLQGAPIARACF